MKQFLASVFRFGLIGFIPLLLLFFLYVTLDPFMVLRSYETYYDPNATAWIGINKGYVSTSMFMNNYQKEHYNSFILGNSRSFSYQAAAWKKHLSPQSKCFHFDGISETLYAIGKKVEFLDSKGANIENVLLVLDASTLMQDKPKTGHLYVTPPALVGGRNIMSFHFQFFKAFISPKFLYPYLSFVISGEGKPSRKGPLELPKGYEPITNEIGYEQQEHLIAQNKYYTPEVLSTFKRDSIVQSSPQVILDGSKEILTGMKAVFDKHRTNYKIVIGPTYDWVLLHQHDLKYLTELFGKENVFDYTGRNRFTEDYKNYYDPSHYRTHVATEIMNEMYESNPSE